MPAPPRPAPNNPTKGLAILPPDQADRVWKSSPVAPAQHSIVAGPVRAKNRAVQTCANPLRNGLINMNYFDHAVLQMKSGAAYCDDI